MRGGRCTAFDQNYKIMKSDKIFRTISEELKLEGNICEVIVAYVKYMGKKNNGKTI